MKIFLILLLHTVSIFSLAQLKPVGSGIYHWADIKVKKDKQQRELRKILAGTTNEFDYFEIHATTIPAGTPPKPSHTQKDKEEVIIIKEGIMKCNIGSKAAILGPGSVLLIPPFEKQAIENIGKDTLTYYVLVSRSAKPMNMERSTQAGGTLLLYKDTLPYKETAKGGTRKYFDRPTAMCDNYEMHVTYLAHKGANHTPHQHVDTEIILMIDGETEMTIDGKTYQAGAGDLYIIESGKLHGISNATEKPCSYFAFKWR